MRKTRLRYTGFVIVVALVIANMSIPSVSADHNDKSFCIRIDTNTPVLRLYQSDRLIRTYPVALGTRTTQTPIGSWEIVDKQQNWGKGFGTRWLGLNVPWGIYGIHGTNRPESIGKFASNGCIRMFNSDVEQLYQIAPIGTPVEITGNPLAHLRVLKHGDIGADVQFVQERLKTLGYYEGEPDGIFGFGTQFALIYFQLANDLPMLGKVTLSDYKELNLIGQGNSEDQQLHLTR